MSKLEIQTEILSKTNILLKLASAISTLPESETRDKLQDKHDKVAIRLATMQDVLGQIDKDACYFGFTDKCPGCACPSCKYYRETDED